MAMHRQPFPKQQGSHRRGAYFAARDGVVIIRRDYPRAHSRVSAAVALLARARTHPADASSGNGARDNAVGSGWYDIRKTKDETQALDRLHGH